MLLLIFLALYSLKSGKAQANHIKCSLLCIVHQSLWRFAMLHTQTMSCASGFNLSHTYVAEEIIMVMRVVRQYDCLYMCKYFFAGIQLCFCFNQSLVKGFMGLLCLCNLILFGCFCFYLSSDINVKPIDVD